MALSSTSDTAVLTPIWVNSHGMEPNPLQRSNTFRGLPKLTWANRRPPHFSSGLAKVSLERVGAPTISCLTTPSAASTALPPLLSTKKARKPHLLTPCDSAAWSEPWQQSTMVGDCLLHGRGVDATDLCLRYKYHGWSSQSGTTTVPSVSISMKAMTALFTTERGGHTHTFSSAPSFTTLASPMHRALLEASFGGHCTSHATAPPRAQNLSHFADWGEAYRSTV